MNDILIKINLLSRNKDETLYHFISEQLTCDSKDLEFWLGLALIIVKPPFGDEEKSILFLNKALNIDNDNPIALLILAHVYEFELGGINDMLLYRIKNLNTGSDEINSMLKYVASWSYADGKKNDPEMEEKLLKKSIELCDKHVWNYEHLARLYLKQKRYLEVNSLIGKALENIKKIYSDDDIYDKTDINVFLNERIKGIHLNEICVEIVKEKLVPKHIIVFYMITTPILNFYRWIRKAFLHLGEL
jgi:tetratricopeptide (TPR) repeat protein